MVISRSDQNEDFYTENIDHLSLRMDEQRGLEHYSVEELYSCEMVPKDIALVFKHEPCQFACPRS